MSFRLRWHRDRKHANTIWADGYEIVKEYAGRPGYSLFSTFGSAIRILLAEDRLRSVVMKHAQELHSKSPDRSPAQREYYRQTDAEHNAAVAEADAELKARVERVNALNLKMDRLNDQFSIDYQVNEEGTGILLKEQDAAYLLGLLDVYEGVAKECNRRARDMVELKKRIGELEAKLRDPQVLIPLVKQRCEQLQQALTLAHKRDRYENSLNYGVISLRANNVRDEYIANIRQGWI